MVNLCCGCLCIRLMVVVGLLVLCSSLLELWRILICL